MKRTYISPSSKVYAMNAKNVFMDNLSLNNGSAVGSGNGDDSEVKEQKSSSGIWDLYN